MKQVVQPLSGGPVRVVEVPRPSISATEVLVQTRFSIVSPGTEQALTRLARSGLVGKARARPDLVRQVVRKARTEGLRSTARTVKGRLSEDLPLGYSASGVAVEVGDAVAGIEPGVLVATGGAGKANHAEFQGVPGLLCVPVPEGVAPRSAAFATIASIALHGFRSADVRAGSKVAVVGLGLVGQLGARIARASGCDVVGLDIAPHQVDVAVRTGLKALVDEGERTTKEILGWSRDRGCDAVLVTAATKSSEVVRRSTELCRDRAEVVIVGDVGLNIDRRPFYEKELSLRFARSYGPGRYDMSYEQLGIDYPPGHVRWTEGRNMEAVLDLIASGALSVEDLITHSFDISQAQAAYELIDGGKEPYLGIAISYGSETEDRPIILRPTNGTQSPAVGLIGAGSFASSVLVPAMKEAGFERFVSVASASGLSARTLAEAQGFEKVVSGADQVIEDPEVDVVVIATPHSTHAELTVRALNAGKHVFCEKPLALTLEELESVENTAANSQGILWVGFNRRWSWAIDAVREHLGDSEPLAITYRVNFEPTPRGHWYEDRREGGRLIGEACHFIDTCIAIAKSGPREVCSIRAAKDHSADEAVIGLGFNNGSIASITYTSGGPPGLAKERIEALGGGRRAVVNDFRTVERDGRRSLRRPQDKGHGRQMRVLLDSIRAGKGSPEPSFLTSMRVTLACAAGASPKLLGQPDPSAADSWT